MTGPGFALDPDGGERLVFGGVTILVRASAEMTGGAFSLFEEVPPLVDTPLHVHENEDERSTRSGRARHPGRHEGDHHTARRSRIRASRCPSRAAAVSPFRGACSSPSPEASTGSSASSRRLRSRDARLGVCRRFGEVPDYVARLAGRCDRLATSSAARGGVTRQCGQPTAGRGSKLTTDVSRSPAAGSVPLVLRIGHAALGAVVAHERRPTQLVRTSCAVL